MKKIPTVFRRNPDDMAHVTDEVNPGCEWVLDGEGIATRKYDGTCVMFDGRDWWARREVKPGKTPPPGWVEADHDETTGKRPGWEPIEQSPFAKFHAEAVDHWDAPITPWRQGTYELCGPKVQGNPEGYDGHVLVRHADAETVLLFDFPDPDFRDFEFVVGDLLRRRGWEGVVWHHPDGRMAKLKARDYEARP